VKRNRPTPAGEKKKPSGAWFKKERRQRAAEDAAREQERTGLQARWDALLERLGEPPLEPVENSEYANNLAMAMAHITALDSTIPMQERFKAVANLLDRVGATAMRALTAKRIREVRDAASASPQPMPVEGTELVGPGRSLRAKTPITPGAIT
jgi:hypothetical protein